MCTGIEILLLVGAGASAGSAVVSSRAQANAMDEQSAQLNQGAAERDQAAAEEADRIRRAGKKQRAQAKAIYAASGLDVGAGSPVVIDESIAAGAESDAFATITTQGRVAARERQQAVSYAKSARTTRTSGLLSAAGSLFGSAAGYSQSTYKPGWRTNQNDQYYP